MKMGYYRPRLNPLDGGYSAETMLPVCVTGTMEWAATILLSTPTAAWRFPSILKFPEVENMMERLIHDEPPSSCCSRRSASSPAHSSGSPSSGRRLETTATAIRASSRARNPSAVTSPCKGPDGPVALADYRGKVVLLWRGYTFCPRRLPTALSLVAQALSELSPAELEKTRGIFVSVDRARHRRSSEGLRTVFHPNIVGITGSADQVVRSRNTAPAI